MKSSINNQQSKIINAAICALAAALNELVAVRRAELEFQRRCAVTKEDLAAVKKEIIDALGARVDPAAVKGLTTASAKLEKAVAANQPISGMKPG